LHVPFWQDVEMLFSSGHMAAAPLELELELMLPLAPLELMVPLELPLELIAPLEPMLPLEVPPSVAPPLDDPPPLEDESPPEELPPEELLDEPLFDEHALRIENETRQMRAETFFIRQGYKHSVCPAKSDSGTAT
jgi:hypothetical protein